MNSTSGARCASARAARAARRTRGAARSCGSGPRGGGAAGRWPGAAAAPGTAGPAALTSAGQRAPRRRRRGRRAGMRTGVDQRRRAPCTAPTRARSSGRPGPARRVRPRASSRKRRDAARSCRCRSRRGGPRRRPPRRFVGERVARRARARSLPAARTRRRARPAGTSGPRAVRGSRPRRCEHRRRPAGARRVAPQQVACTARRGRAGTLGIAARGARRLGRSACASSTTAGVARERQLPGQRLVEHRRRRCTSRWPRVRGSRGGLLGRHVGRRCRTAARARCCVAGADELGDQAEVEQHHAAVAGDQHVRRLDVAVELAGLVQRGRRRAPAG